MFRPKGFQTSQTPQTFQPFLSGQSPKVLVDTGRSPAPSSMLHSQTSSACS